MTPLKIWIIFVIAVMVLLVSFVIVNVVMCLFFNMGLFSKLCGRVKVEGARDESKQLIVECSHTDSDSGKECV